MKKKYLLLFVLCLFSSLIFSQTKKIVTAKSVKTTQSNSKPISETQAASTATVLEKIPLPQKTKSYPEIVYVIDDKPVDYRTYIHYLQKKNKK